MIDLTLEETSNESNSISVLSTLSSVQFALGTKEHDGRNLMPSSRKSTFRKRRGRSSLPTKTQYHSQ